MGKPAPKSLRKKKGRRPAWGALGVDGGFVLVTMHPKHDKKTKDAARYCPFKGSAFPESGCASDDAEPINPGDGFWAARAQSAP